MTRGSGPESEKICLLNRVRRPMILRLTEGGGLMLAEAFPK